LADNVDITAGSGTTIATDDCTTGQVQLVKLAYGADGNRTQVVADADGLLVNLGANNDITVTGSGLTALQLIDDPIFTDDTAFTLATSKVNMAGAVAVSHGTNPTAVAANDAIAMITNRHRIPFVMGGHPNIVTTRTTYSAAAQTDIAIGPGTIGTGTRIVVTQAQVTVSNATTATPSVIIGFGLVNTPTGTGVVIAHPGIPGGGGVSRGDGSGIIGVGGDGEELRITSAAATGGVMDVVVSFYTIES
jgi:hypothetical protein